jgi:hypothetical protein
VCRRHSRDRSSAGADARVTCTGGDDWVMVVPCIDRGGRRFK